jgi:hypothetical protein
VDLVGRQLKAAKSAKSACLTYGGSQFRVGVAATEPPSAIGYRTPKSSQTRVRIISPPFQCAWRNRMGANNSWSRGAARLIKDRILETGDQQ